MVKLLMSKIILTKHLTLLCHRMTRIFPIFLFIGLAWGQAFNENFQQITHTEISDNGIIDSIKYFKIVDEKVKSTKTEYFYYNGQMECSKYIFKC
jgi:hypothetical protein